MKLIEEREDMIHPLKKYFLYYRESVTFAPASSLMLLKKMNEKGVMKKLKNENVNSMFFNCLNADGYVPPDKGTKFLKERICNYFGTKYCDDLTLEEDIENKGSLNNLLRLLMENEKALNLNAKSKYVILFIMNELDRNIRNHSGFKDSDNKYYDYMYMCYPENNMIQLVVLDEGQGIKGSLKTHGDSVLEAVEMGVTARSNHDFTSGDGKNSGYGLYLMNELSKRGHLFEIIDNEEYYYSENKGLIKYGNIKTLGINRLTMVSIVIDIENISQDLKDIQTNTEHKSAKSIVTFGTEEEINHKLNKIYTKLRKGGI